jgi:hypothetical protein
MTFINWVLNLSATDQIGWAVTIIVLIIIAIYGIKQSDKQKGQA